MLPESKPLVHHPRNRQGHLKHTVVMARQLRTSGKTRVATIRKRAVISREFDFPWPSVSVDFAAGSNVMWHFGQSQGSSCHNSGCRAQVCAPIS